jgi:glycosyltransferase involved in cell wall biosynthesis
MSFRVLHLLTSPHLGGAEVMCIRLCSELRALGHDTVIYAVEQGKASDAAVAESIPVIFFPGKRSANKLAFHRAVQDDLQRQIAQFKPDLVHSHVPFGNLMASRAVTSIPWIATVHGSWKQFAYSPLVANRPHLKLYFLLRYALGDYWSTRKAKCLVAISDYVKSELTGIGISSHKIRRIHNGIPAASATHSQNTARQHFGFAQDHIVIGSLGHLSPVKGFDLLISAFALLADRYPQLSLSMAGGDVMGDTSYRQKLQQQIRGTGLEHRISLLGELDDCALFLSALDIFVVASRTEGFSLVLAQAMQCGKPSVVTSAGGCVEVARPDQEAIVFESRNVQSLAAALEKLILEPELRSKFSDSAIHRANTYLTMQRCAEEYHSLYHEIVVAP